MEPVISIEKRIFITDIDSTRRLSPKALDRMSRRGRMILLAPMAMPRLEKARAEMSLLKLFWSQPNPGTSSSPTEYDWDVDLFDHPDIVAMSQRELADLPLPMPASHRTPQRQLEKCV
jgi:hypothetical protein